MIRWLAKRRLRLCEDGLVKLSYWWAFKAKQTPRQAEFYDKHRLRLEMTIIDLEDLLGIRARGDWNG
jgi:hypothetical protein